MSYVDAITERLKTGVALEEDENNQAQNQGKTKAKRKPAVDRAYESVRDADYAGAAKSAKKVADKFETLKPGMSSRDVGAGIRNNAELALTPAMIGAKATYRAIGDAASGIYEAGKGIVTGEGSAPSPAPNQASTPTYGVMPSDKINPQSGALEAIQTQATGKPGLSMDSLENPNPMVTPDNQGPAQPYKAAFAENHSGVANNFLRENSQSANEDLNAGRRQVVPGLHGVSYAGKYGKTDVFAGVTENADGTKTTNFSDVANLATTRGGKAAEIPEGKVANTGNDGLSPEQRVRAGSIDKSSSLSRSVNTVDSTFFTGPEGLDKRQAASLDPRVQKARAAAIERGDLKSAERSLMSNSELAQVKSEGHRDSAYRENPVAAYATDQDSLSSVSRQRADAAQLAYNRQKDSLKRKDSQERRRFDENKALAKIIADMDANGTLPVDATIEEKRRHAKQLLDGEVFATPENQDQEALSSIQAFL